MKTKQINKEYFEDRNKELSATIERIYAELRTLDEKENVIKNQRVKMSTELIRLQGEQRFIGVVMSQFEVNADAEPSQSDAAPQGEGSGKA